MCILGVQDELINVFVCVCDEFSGEFWGQTFVYLSISCGTTVYPVQNLSPEVLVTVTWTWAYECVRGHTGVCEGHTDVCEGHTGVGVCVGIRVRAWAYGCV